jgi:hypothetical protein
MKVKELIELLSRCEPEAEICLETHSCPKAKKVYQCKHHVETLIYITDDFSCVEYDLKNEDYEIKEIKAGA